MRCTKCGYISFDHLEHCRKCRKPINDADCGISGTVFDTVVPTFLKFAVQEEADDALIGDVDNSFDDLGDFEDDFGDAFLAEEEDGAEGAVELADIIIEPDGEDSDDDMAFDLDDLDDAAPLEEFSLNADIDEAQEEVSESSPIDFGDLDISDLAPPETKEEKELAEERSEDIDGALDSLDVDLEKDVPAEVETPASAKESGPGMGGLEDLLVDQLDLDNIDKPVLGKRAAKSVKTGTALDNFDIDLGDLFTENK